MNYFFTRSFRYELYTIYLLVIATVETPTYFSSLTLHKHSRDCQIFLIHSWVDACFSRKDAAPLAPGGTPMLEI